jgi:hypothetical protein
MMIRALIAFIAQKHRVDVNAVSVAAGILDEDQSLNAFYDSPNQIFAFSKSASQSIVTSLDSSDSRPGSILPPLHSKPGLVNPMCK